MDKKEENIPIAFESLILKLAAEGFKMSVDTIVRIQRVLEEFGKEFSGRPQDLKQILCPLIARNKAEQEKFNQVFDNYFSRIWEDAIRISDRVLIENTIQEHKHQEKTEKEPKEEICTEDTSLKEKTKTMKWGLWIVLGIILVLIGSLSTSIKKYFVPTTACNIPEPSFNFYSEKNYYTIHFENMTDGLSSKDLAFDWDFGDGNANFKSNDKEVIHAYKNCGKYFVKLKATRSNDCFKSISKEIDILSEFKPLFSIEPRIASVDEDITFKNSTPHIEGVKFRIYFSDGTDAPFDSDVRHRYNDAGQYTITVTGEFPWGCIKQNSLPLIVFLGKPPTGTHSWLNKFDWIFLIAISLLALTAYISVIILLISTLTPQKHYSLKMHPPYFIPFPPQNRLIKLAPEFYTITNAMRQRHKGEISSLDIPATVSSTIRSGGFPELKFKYLSNPPEYLVLIDKQGIHNQQAALFEHLVDSLEREDIFINRFFYHTDPRVCWNKEFPDGLTLDELHVKYSKHRLVILGDGAYLVNPFEAQLADWAKTSFKNWNEKALLTPIAVTDWGYKEQLLNAELFVILPADINGQLALVESIVNPGKNDFKAVREQFLKRDQKHIRINFEDIADLKELKEYLGDEHLFIWVCASSVFHRAAWEITLAVGKNLERYFRKKEKEEQLLTYNNLLKLSRIKWFQAGDIPEKIRGQILNHPLITQKILDSASQAVSAIVEPIDVPVDSVAYKETEFHLKQKIKKPFERIKKFCLFCIHFWGILSSLLYLINIIKLTIFSGGNIVLFIYSSVSALFCVMSYIFLHVAK